MLISNPPELVAVLLRDGSLMTGLAGMELSSDGVSLTMGPASWLLSEVREIKLVALLDYPICDGGIIRLETKPSLACAVCGYPQDMHDPDDERDDCASKHALLRSATSDLVKKLVAIDASPSMRSIYTTAYSHGVVYDGPNYELELAIASEALKVLEER